MCGIAGYWDFKKKYSHADNTDIGHRMIATLNHRGPDGRGVWVDDRQSLVLSHSRLSIQDLSEAGAQPMTSLSQRYVITFNGEIYNFRDLRKELNAVGITLRGRSDTEVLLEGIALWGIETMLIKCNGMFAFVLWDRESNELILARDRVGKKPIYYGIHNDVLIFGSELKALEIHPDFVKDINLDSLTLFTKYSWVQSPHCIYQNTNKLNPATYVKINAASRLDNVNPVSYWSVDEVLTKAIKSPFKGDILEAETEIELLLEDATNKRMIADVETGALLSGGIDSSVVTALMQKNSSTPVKTFSIGYHEESHNEADHAKRVAEYLGTEHSELYVTAKDSMSVIDRLPNLYDEPFADVSQIPTFLVSQLAHQQVKVVLTGDGGDETFAGYSRYTRCLERWNHFNQFSDALKGVIGKFSSIFWRTKWEVEKFNPRDRCGSRKIGKYLKLSRRITAESPEELFCRMNMRYGEKEKLVLGGREPENIFSNYLSIPSSAPILKKFLYLDYVNYLVDDVMAKVDRAAMGVSLETRSPILDYRVLEAAWSMPEEYLLHQGNKKRLLKNILYKHVPKNLVDRPKFGFGVPIGEWLRGELNEWANDLLGETYIRQQGIFDYKLIKRYWRQHEKDCAKHDTLIWSILMFQSWYKEHIS